MSLFNPNNSAMGKALSVVDAGIKAVKAHPSYCDLTTIDGRTIVSFTDGTAVKLTLGLRDSNAEKGAELRLDFSGKTFSLST